MLSLLERRNDNMAKENMFARAAGLRENEQERIKQDLQSQASGEADEPRTTMTLSMSVSDKIALKMIATKRKKTVSKMLHEWIIELQQEDEA